MIARAISSIAKVDARPDPIVARLQTKTPPATNKRRGIRSPR
jgi:hypothetical protein